MKVVDEILAKLEYCIVNDTYEPLETEFFEIKDNSSSSSKWKEIYKSTCAFLNTSGGVILLGVKEDTSKKKYILTGYDENQESNFIDLPKQFTTNKREAIDLSPYIQKLQIKDMLDKRVLLINVEKLPDEIKFVKFNGDAWERKLTGEHKISPQKILMQEEYKVEIQDARELRPVIHASLSDLNVDKLNDYINELNREVKIESLKPDIASATSFLQRKKFIRNDEPTVLGMLVCGDHLDDFLRFRSQVDCYVDSSEEVVDNKKIIKDNVLNLMERTTQFVTQNIQTGISYKNAGTLKSEYPIRLIRESINNALAHRDYSMDKYATVKVFPNSRIEIRNPGCFKQQLLIEDIYGAIPLRRIIAGNPKTVNPRLADVLKVFDKWEGQGFGMSALTNACLANEIDLPYYRFHGKDELSLVIPKGKLLDSEFNELLEQYSGFVQEKTAGRSLTEDQQTVLAYFYKSELANSNDRYTILLTKDNNHLEAIRFLETYHLIEKHEKSDELNTIYVVAREFFQVDHFGELQALFGNDFITIKEEYKHVLNTILHYNNFSTEALTAQKVGDSLWIKAGKSNEIEGYESFKRKIRNIVRRLTTDGFLIKPKGYEVNKSYHSPTLFNNPKP